MADLQEYKCPNCGGAISFDSTLQKMKCPYCDAEFEVEALKQYDEALHQDTEDHMNWKVCVRMYASPAVVKSSVMKALLLLHVPSAATPSW